MHTKSRVAATAVGIAHAQMDAAFADSTTIAEVTVPAHAFAQALSKFDDTVAGLGAGGQTAADIQALIADDGVVIADLDSVGSQSVGTFLSWRSQTKSDGQKATAASNAVRADLGLPPAGSGRSATAAGLPVPRPSRHVPGRDG